MEKRGDEWWYFVLWENYGEDEGTWEPESNLGGCPEKIESFRKANLLERSEQVKSAGDENEEATNQQAIAETPSVVNHVEHQPDAEIDVNEKSSDKSFAIINKAEITAELSSTSNKRNGIIKIFRHR